MKMCPIDLRIAVLGALAIASPECLTGEIDPQIEDMRPRTIFLEDFEKLEIGTEPAEGGVIQSYGDSKQLVVKDGTFAWTSNEIALSEPLLTSVQLDIKAVAGPGGFHEDDHIRVYAKLSDNQTAPRAILDLKLGDASSENGEITLKSNLPVGALAQRKWTEEWINHVSGSWQDGIIIKPTWMRVAMEVTLKSSGTVLAVDNIAAKQESVDLHEDDWRLANDYSAIRNYTVIGNVIGPEVASHMIETSFNNLGSDVKKRLEEATLCLGTTSYYEVQSLRPVEFLEHSKDRYNDDVVRFRMDRPKEGWESLTEAPSLFFCDAGATPESVDPNRRKARWENPPWIIEQPPQRPSNWSEAAQGEFYYVPELVFEPESVAPLQGNEPFIDFTVRLNSSLPYTLENPETIDVFVVAGQSRGDSIQANFMGVTEILDEGRIIRLSYRALAPAHGWPTQKMQVNIDTGRRYLRQAAMDGTNNFIPVAPGRKAVKVFLPEGDRIPPGEAPVGPNPQIVLVSEDTFTTQVDYSSDVAIDVSTIGDGDVILRGNPTQEGKLVSTESLDNGRTIRATFEFQRDSYGYRKASSAYYVPLDYPSGSVYDVEGNTTFGRTNVEYTGPKVWEVPESEREEVITIQNNDVAPRLWSPQDSIITAFLPLSKMKPALEAFRFRVIYQSENASILASDLAGNHIVMNPDPLTLPEDFRIWKRAVTPEWFPTVTSVRPLHEGRTLEVDYRVDKPDTGWPAVSRLRLFAGSIRDSSGGTLLNRDLATVGRTDLAESDVDIQLIGGAVIEGDPDTHRLSFLLPNRPQGLVWGPTNQDPYDGAYVWLGLNPGIMPSFEKDTAPPVLGPEREIIKPLGYSSQIDYNAYFLGLSDFENPTPEELAEFERLQALGAAEGLGVLNFDSAPKSVLHIDIDRPEGGWDTWEVGRVPYLLHAPGLEGIPNSVIASGHIAIVDRNRSLPLLFSFEEWVKQLEEQTELPEGSLVGDLDGDGQDSLAEFALGSDPLDKNDAAAVEPTMMKRDGQRHVALEFPIRTNSLGIIAELQHSLDGKEWRAVEDDFEVIERRRLDAGTDEVKLCAKEPLAPGVSAGLFRIAIVR